jgi:diguanylate cyclase (GGDEF)-like protein
MQRPQQRVSTRVVELALFLGVLGLLLVVPILGRAAATSGIHLPALTSLALFALAGSVVVHLRLGRDAHEISLRDLAVVLGLSTMGPGAYVLTHTVGALLPMAARRPSPLKLVFNAGLLLGEAGLAVFTYRTVLGDGDALGARGVAATYVAVLVLDLFSTAAVTAVIRVHSGRTELPRRSVVVLGLVAALLSASVALLALVLLVEKPPALGLLGLLLAALVLAYRNQVRLSATKERLEVLYAVTRAAGRALVDDTVEETILAEAREVLQAERVELHILEGDDLGRSVACDDDGYAEDALVREPWWTAVLDGEVVHRTPHSAGDGPADALAVPLHRNGQVCGALIARDRMGDSALFTEDDAQVFAALAGTVSVALRNAGLLQRLRTQAAQREHELRHDLLTGLLNRRGLTERLDDVRSPHALVCLSLEDFAQVQDALGHEVGASLVAAVARRLAASFPTAELARLGYGEFALLVAGADREGVAARVRDCLREPFASSGLRIPLSASLGSLVLPQADADGALLLRRADLARSRAVRHRLAHAGYDPADEAASRGRLALVGDLREALDGQRLHTVYQPQLDLASGRVRCLEALVRWTHPTVGAVPPDRFVPLAEQAGLIDDLTSLVLRKALSDAARWRADGLIDAVAVNLSARSLASPGLTTTVSQALGDRGLPAAALTLELTETAVVADPHRAAEVLRDLAELGVRLSLDDFGTGYSSLTLLRQLPLHEVKIDKSFVSRMCTDRSDAAVVRSTIALAHDLGLRTVAEGVEDEPTLAALKALSCDVAQGYHIARPSQDDDVQTWLEGRIAGADGGKPSESRSPLATVRKGANSVAG